MTSTFTQVRYGSKFKPLSPKQGYRKLNPYLPQQRPTLGSLLTSAGAGGNPTSYEFPKFSPPSTTPATPPAAPPAAAPKPAAATPPANVDLSSDPILMQIRSMGDRRIADARTGALGSAEQALIGYGSTQVPQTLRDLYATDPSNPIYAALNDANTAAIADANPDSYMRQLQRAHERNVANVDTADGNTLWYSSQHANDLADEANAYRVNQSQATQSLAQTLAQAYGGVLDAQQQGDSEYVSGLSDAYARWLAAHPDGLAAATDTAPAADTPAPTVDAGNKAAVAGEGWYYNPTTGEYRQGRPARGTWAVL